jgi:2-polyprenyl-3-methyl-5-hydroxy-6-metoxy-1,4-benzoquinol methylase
MNSENFVKCRVCESSNLKVFSPTSFVLSFESSNSNLHEYENLRCNNCGVIVQSEEITDSKLAEYYDGEYRKYECRITDEDWELTPPIKYAWSEVSFLRAQTFINVINASNVSIKKNHEHLDIGGYQGVFSWALSERYKLNSTLVDYNNSGLEHAAGFLGVGKTIQITESLLQTLKDIPDSSFHIITMNHVFEHIKNPIEILDQIKRLLKNGGFFYVEVPNSRAYPLSDPTHVVMYDRSSLGNLFNLNNLEICHLTTTGFPEYPFHGYISSSDQNIAVLAKKKAGGNKLDNSYTSKINSDGFAQFSSETKSLRRQIAFNILCFSARRLYSDFRMFVKGLVGVIIG